VKYSLKNGEELVEMEIETDGNERFTAIVGQNRLDVAFRRISRHRILLSVDGRQTMAFVSDAPEGRVVVIRGRDWLLEDNAARRGPSRGAFKDSPRTVSPPMPAVVTRILVAEGETVEKGQAVVVVSAMKMDTTLTAPFDGEIIRINVAEGDKVTPGQVLVDIDPAQTEPAATATG
jgi:biotin carboxyl carrier protein